MEQYKKRNKKESQQKTDLYLKKHVGLIHCENKLTLIQRKISNIFLFNALDKIKEQEIHQIPIKHLCSLVGYNSNDIKLIKAAVKSLISVVMEWNLLDDNRLVLDGDLNNERISWNASSLLAGATIRGGLVHYSYSPQMKSILNTLDVYGRINLFVQSKFKSTYSLVLYENCVRFKNIKQTSWFSLKLFRSLMGVSDEKYKTFKEFKRNVINVAVQEVNQKSDIFIEPQFKKTGRSVSAIQFLLKENERYKPSFKKIATPAPIENQDLQRKSALIELLVNEFNLQIEQVNDLTTQYSHDYISEKITLIRSQTNIHTPGAFLIAAIKKDYQKQLSKPKPVLVEKVEYKRESKQPSEIQPLRNKYLQYKVNAYRQFIASQSIALQVDIHTGFELVLKQNHELFKIYQRKQLSSPFIMTEFLLFIDKHYPNIVGEYDNFDDYITSEVT